MSSFPHPLVTPKHDHQHLPYETVLMFKVSRNFTDVVRFYFQSSLLLKSKNNDVDRRPSADIPEYDPDAIIREFAPAWVEEEPRFIAALSQMFSNVQRQCTVSDGICVQQMKEVFLDKLAYTLSKLIQVADYSVVGSKVMFDFDFIPLTYNDQLRSKLPPDVLRHIDSVAVARDNIYSVLLDVHHMGTKTTSPLDHTNDEQFMKRLAVRSNMLFQSVATDSVNYNSDKIVRH